MQISLEWVRDFVELPPLETLVDKLTAAGIEVETVDDPASRVRGVVIGRVESVEPHPQADKLQVCQVNSAGYYPAMSSP